MTKIEENRQNIDISVFHQSFSPVKPTKIPKNYLYATQYAWNYCKSKKNNDFFANHGIGRG